MQDHRQQQLFPNDREEQELLNILNRLTRKMGGKSKMIQFSNDHRHCIDAISKQSSNTRTVLQCVDKALERLQLTPEIRKSLRVFQIKSPLVEEQVAKEAYLALNPEPELAPFSDDEMDKSSSNEWTLHDDILNTILSEDELPVDRTAYLDKMEPDAWLEYLDEITALESTNGLSEWEIECVAPSSDFLTREEREKCIGSPVLLPTLETPCCPLNKKIESLERDIGVLKETSKRYV
ncbi:uncharacterized protein N7484_006748 [Penicillium longicatenatum]|uniref:uncharacterized protein n=1 Tax=Penicillium longicatenatum TaxID=1561947 RepID=UPI002549A01A|nr:uncharacterized protein N7484_006748 [Penicillium longicatenatum]KAJ5644241.1 hypothetical protein N7484_006748 [Penicillium longicatenatum]